MMHLRVLRKLDNVTVLLVSTAADLLTLLASKQANIYCPPHTARKVLSGNTLAEPTIIVAESTTAPATAQVVVFDSCTTTITKMLELGPVLLTLCNIESPEEHAHILSIGIERMNTATFKRFAARVMFSYNKGAAAKRAHIRYMDRVLDFAAFKEALWHNSDVSARWVRQLACLTGRKYDFEWVRRIACSVVEGALGVSVPVWIATSEVHVAVLTSRNVLAGARIPLYARDVVLFVAAHAISRALANPPETAQHIAVCNIPPNIEALELLLCHTDMAIAVTFTKFAFYSGLIATHNSLTVKMTAVILRLLTPQVPTPWVCGIMMSFSSSAIVHRHTLTDVIAILFDFFSVSNVPEVFICAAGSVMAHSSCRLRFGGSGDDRAFVSMFSIMRRMTPVNSKRMVDHMCIVLGGIMCDEYQFTHGGFESIPGEGPNATTMYCGHVSRCSGAEVPNYGAVDSVCWACNAKNVNFTIACAACDANLKCALSGTLGSLGVYDDQPISVHTGSFDSPKHGLHMVRSSGALGLLIPVSASLSNTCGKHVRSLERHNSIFVFRFLDNDFRLMAYICVATVFDMHNGSGRRRYAHGLAAHPALMAARAISSLHVSLTRSHAAWWLVAAVAIGCTPFMHDKNTYGVVCAVVDKTLGRFVDVRTHAAGCKDCAFAIASLYVGFTGTLRITAPRSVISLGQLFLSPSAQANSTRLTVDRYASWAATMAANELGPAPTQQLLHPSWARLNTRVNVRGTVAKIVGVHAGGVVVQSAAMPRADVRMSEIDPVNWNVPVSTVAINDMLALENGGVTPTRLNGAVFTLVVEPRLIKMCAVAFAVMTASDISASPLSVSIPEAIVLYILEMVVAADMCAPTGNLAGWSASDQLRCCRTLCQKHSVFPEVPTVSRSVVSLWD